MTDDTVDCLVVGGGPGGVEVACGLAAAGLRTLLVERSGVGGTCLHTGCIPAKLLLERAHRNAEVEDVGRLWKSYRSDLDELIARHRRGATRRLERAGVEVLSGQASPDPGGVRVALPTTEHRLIRPQRALVLATGSRPAPAPFPVEGKALLTTDSVFFLDQVPDSIVVVGGGAVGVELADAFAALGSKVVLVELAGQLLPGEDPEIAAILHQRLADKGITVRVGIAVMGVENAAVGEARHVRLADGDTVSASAVLLAAGRSPVRDPWPELPGVDVVEIGDRAGGGLAHEATAMGQAAAAAITGSGDRRIGTVPRCVYTDPEVASAGLTALAAAQTGVDVVEGKAPWSANPRADIRGETGLTKVVADRRSGRLLGVHLVGAAAAELAGLGCAWLDFEAGLEDLRWSVLPHPTVSETLREAALHALSQLEVP